MLRNPTIPFLACSTFVWNPSQMDCSPTVKDFQAQFDDLGVLMSSHGKWPKASAFTKPRNCDLSQFQPVLGVVWLYSCICWPICQTPHQLLLEVPKCPASKHRLRRPGRTGALFLREKNLQSSKKQMDHLMMVLAKDLALVACDKHLEAPH